MTNFYSLISNGLASDLYEYFKLNSSRFDKFFNILKYNLVPDDNNKEAHRINDMSIEGQGISFFPQAFPKPISPLNTVNSESSAPNQIFKFLNYNFDYRMNLSEFNDIIFNKWKPKMIYICDSGNINAISNNDSYSLAQEKYKSDTLSLQNWIKENFTIIKNEDFSNCYGGTCSPSKVNDLNEILKNKEKTQSGYKVDFDICINMSDHKNTNSNHNSHLSNQNLLDMSLIKANIDIAASATYESKLFEKEDEKPQLKFLQAQKFANDTKMDLDTENYKGASNFKNNFFSYVDFNSKLKPVEKINFDKLYIENAFLTDKKDYTYDNLTKDILHYSKKSTEKNETNGILEGKEIKIKIEKENDKFYFQPLNSRDSKDTSRDIKEPGRSKSKAKDSSKPPSCEIEAFENYLNEILIINNMKIYKINNNEEASLIEITIVKEQIKKTQKNLNTDGMKEYNQTFSEIKIFKSNSEQNSQLADLEITCENLEDNNFLNVIFSNVNF